MKKETTLILVKPDAVADGLTGEVFRRLEKEGLRIINCRMTRLHPALLREHYAHLAHLPFFPEIEQFMGVRELLGPTDSTKAPKGTIRGDLGKDKMHNVAHASDSPENAKAELKRFFGTEEPEV
ncbi:MAG: nucleoside-diphosphate kinase [Verrucomicrobia bacterium]|nr:nucleoside-diphosphate kinase [Verrucomicrobiota bacterium]